MIHADPSILRVWRERSREDSQVTVRMLLLLDDAKQIDLQTVKTAVVELQPNTPNETDVRPGERSCLRLADGVLVEVRDAEAFDALLPELVLSLERRGVRGKLSSWEPRLRSLLRPRARCSNAASASPASACAWVRDAISGPPSPQRSCAC